MKGGKSCSNIPPFCILDSLPGTETGIKANYCFLNNIISKNFLYKNVYRRDGDIINQYIAFTKVCNELVEAYSGTRRTIQEASRICKDKNVLKEYLESREQEVVDMMTELYDRQ